MSRRIITEEELREAAREVLEYELAIFDSYNDYPDHIFHGKFRLNMAALIHEVKRGAVEAAKYSMGFTFYAKQCIAAVLILFTLSCIAMPETVLAGYHKLIEVIETVFEDYTEYRYRVNDDGGIEETFKPLKLGYLPEGMEEVWREETKNSVDIVYENEDGIYLNVFQTMMSKESNMKYWVDTTDTYIEILLLDDTYIEVVNKNQMIQFIMLDGQYRVVGQTNLSKESFMNVLNEVDILNNE